ncbi:hypothetical protein TNCV_4702611 [Trichonephila clavipes]|nr:hypothetical protein TNCV_4702611 [Trichonephila clavipes]
MAVAANLKSRNSKRSGKRLNLPETAAINEVNLVSNNIRTRVRIYKASTGSSEPHENILHTKTPHHWLVPGQLCTWVPGVSSFAVN